MVLVLGTVKPGANFSNSATRSLVSYVDSLACTVAPRLPKPQTRSRDSNACFGRGRDFLAKHIYFVNDGAP